MSWLDRLLGRPKTASTEDPVGPIGGSLAPVDPTDVAPFIHPGNPGGTWAPEPKDIPSIDSQQTPLMAQGLLPTEGQNPAYMDLQQQTLWPHEVVTNTGLSPAPFRDRGPDPRWDPTAFNPGPQDGHVSGHISYSFNRPWRLSPMLDGNRTYHDAADMPVPSSEGYVGLRTAPRASMFSEPAPWSTNIVDTTSASGTPTTPGTPSQPTSIVVSSDQFPSTNNRSYRLS
jgi:hypothetical protein